MEIWIAKYGFTLEGDDSDEWPRRHGAISTTALLERLHADWRPDLLPKRSMQPKGAISPPYLAPLLERVSYGLPGQPDTSARRRHPHASRLVSPTDAQAAKSFRQRPCKLCRLPLARRRLWQPVCLRPAPRPVLNMPSTETRASRPKTSQDPDPIGLSTSACMPSTVAADSAPNSGKHGRQPTRRQTGSRSANGYERHGKPGLVSLSTTPQQEGNSPG